MTCPAHLSFFQRTYRRAAFIRCDVLNSGSSAAGTSSDNIAQELKQAINAIKAAALDAQTGMVNYAQLANTDIYHTFRQASQALHAFDPATLTSREDKLAFWINLYNVLVIDAVIHYGVTRSIMRVWGIFDRAGYNVGGQFYSLNDIEHGILRANAGFPYFPDKQFTAHDPRLRHVLPARDWRIHFALVCGAQSCPPIAFYDADKIDRQLELAARSFLNQESTLDQATETLTVSRILQWYSGDFGAAWHLRVSGGKAPALVHSIAPYFVDGATQQFLATHADQIRVRFKPYDWALNGR